MFPVQLSEWEVLSLLILEEELGEARIPVLCSNIEFKPLGAVHMALWENILQLPMVLGGTWLSSGLSTPWKASSHTQLTELFLLGFFPVSHHCEKKEKVVLGAVV